MNPSPVLVTRRQILKTAAMSAIAAPFLSTIAHAADASTSKSPSSGTPPMPAPPSDGRENGIRLGVATYSTRELSLENTLSALTALRIVNAGVFRQHCDWEKVTVEEARAMGARFAALGINITGSGVINLTNDEAKCRKAFENVKAAGMQTMVCKPAPEALPLVAKLAKEYDQKLAIHNHGPEDKTYPTPQSVFDAVKSLDARVGLCIDVGHTMRAGGDPAAEIRRFAARTYDIHLKDSAAVSGSLKDIPVEVGAGRMDIRGILKALRDIKYSGVAAIEYEKVGGNPVIGLAESVGHVRGLLRGMA